MKTRITMPLLLIGVLGRLIPHPPSATPLTSVSVLAGVKLPLITSIILTACCLLVSDSLLAYLYGYPLLGSWSLFTYSGFIGVTLLGKCFTSNQTTLRIIGITVVAAVLYWLWTNFGVWLTSQLYHDNIHGLINCYTTALPFLRNSVISSVIWSYILFNSLKGLEHYHERIRNT